MIRHTPLVVMLFACSEYDFVSDPGSVTGETTETTATGDVGLPDTSSADTGPPTDSLPSCGDWRPSQVGLGIVDEECLADPEVGTFDPVIEWQWLSNDVVSGYNMLMMTPVVGHLSDDDRDGSAGPGDIPDIAFTAYTGGSYGSAGTLTAISGDGSGTLWSMSDSGGYGFYGSGGVAIGDLDGDGLAEVCAAGTSAAVVCVAGESGELVWAAGSEISAYGYPAMADLDGDGLGEVIFGRQIFDHTGALVGIGDGGRGGSHGGSFAVDWDGDGDLEVIAGSHIYERDGSTLWSDSVYGDGWPAVGDFDEDGLPDLVRAGGNAVTVTDNAGNLLWTVAVPGSGGGPPTVADFDGDGAPEIGVAGLSYYTLYDTDGAILWSNPTEDDSSSVTGSAVFDFEGDGAAEVVYADEHTLWIYDGTTGAVLMEEGGHASGTLMEYPIVAEVDADGSREIIIGSNDLWGEGGGGVTVIGDASESWAPAREVWNQHAYHITNIDSDGGIPRRPDRNWLTWNSFRAGGAELGPGHWLSDVTPGDAELCLDECSADRVLLSVTIENHGLLDATDVGVALLRYSEDGPAEAVEVVSTVASGGVERTQTWTLTKQDWGPGGLWVALDADDALAECDETNNLLELGDWPCP